MNAGYHMSRIIMKMKGGCISPVNDRTCVGKRKLWLMAINNTETERILETKARINIRLLRVDR